MWTCKVCGQENENNDEICVNCGSYREEPCYDIEADLQDEENTGEDP